MSRTSGETGMRTAKRGESGRKRKQAEGPRKPLSAYIIFSNKRRPSLFEEKPELKSNVPAASRLLGGEWRNMTDGEKVVYHDEARVLKEQYLVEKKDFDNRKKDAGDKEELTEGAGDTAKDEDTSGDEDAAGGDEEYDAAAKVGGRRGTAKPRGNRVRAAAASRKRSTAASGRKGGGTTRTGTASKSRSRSRGAAASSSSSNEDGDDHDAITSSSSADEDCTTKRKVVGGRASTRQRAQMRSPARGAKLDNEDMEEEDDDSAAVDGEVTGAVEGDGDALMDSDGSIDQAGEEQSSAAEGDANSELTNNQAATEDDQLGQPQAKRQKTQHAYNADAEIDNLPVCHDDDTTGVEHDDNAECVGDASQAEHNEAAAAAGSVELDADDQTTAPFTEQSNATEKAQPREEQAEADSAVTTDVNTAAPDACTGDFSSATA